VHAVQGSKAGNRFHLVIRPWILLQGMQSEEVERGKETSATKVWSTEMSGVSMTVTLKKDGEARKCPRCKETKPHEEFYAYLTNPYCKECTREYYRVRNANRRKELAHV